MFDHDKISRIGYSEILKLIKYRIEERERQDKENAAKEKQRMLDEGRRPTGGPAHPIVTPLHADILKAAYLGGLIDEYDIRKRLNNTTKTFESLFE